VIVAVANRFPGPCATCGGSVAAQTGVRRPVDDTWHTYHVDCVPAPAPRRPPPRGTHAGWHRGPLATFDCETTGRDPATARIVQVALVTGDDTRQRFLVDPGVPIPPETTAVHGITTEQVRAHGEPPPVVLDRVADLIAAELRAGVPLVVFNAPYDLTLLEHELARHELPALADRTPVEPIVDPLLIDRWIDRYRGGSRTLAAQCAFYGVELTHAHDATSDALAARELARVIAACYPEIAACPVRELHAAQRRWQREVADDYVAWRMSQGRTPKPRPTGWPLYVATDETEHPGEGTDTNTNTNTNTNHRAPEPASSLHEGPNGTVPSQAAVAREQTSSPQGR
jgi:DNA polymerase-3 subunit epsilon